MHDQMCIRDRVYDDTIAPEDDTATISSHGYQLVMSEGAERMLKK